MAAAGGSGGRGSWRTGGRSGASASSGGTRSSALVLSDGHVFDHVVPVEQRRHAGDDRATSEDLAGGRRGFDQFLAREADTGVLCEVLCFAQSAAKGLSLPALSDLTRAPAHDNVVRVLRIDRSCRFVGVAPRSTPRAGVTCLVSEPRPTLDLFDAVSHTGPLPVPLVRLLARQLLSGLASLHAMGLCHQDLRPETVGLDEACDLRVHAPVWCRRAGPGGAMVLHDRPLGRDMLGYAAPEVVGLRPGEAGAVGSFDAFAADVWSAGGLIFLMLAGFPCLQQPSTEDWWFRQLAAADYSLFWKAHAQNASISAAARAFLEKMLVVDPARRATMTELLADPWLWPPSTGARAVCRDVSAHATASVSADDAELTRAKAELSRVVDAAGLRPPLPAWALVGSSESKLLAAAAAKPAVPARASSPRGGAHGARVAEAAATDSSGDRDDVVAAGERK